jgi:hypothetical protein
MDMESSSFRKDFIVPVVWLMIGARVVAVHPRRTLMHIEMGMGVGTLGDVSPSISFGRPQGHLHSSCTESEQDRTLSANGPR